MQLQHAQHRLWASDLTKYYFRNVRIEGPTVIKDSVIGDNCRIGAFSHLEQVSLRSSLC